MRQGTMSVVVESRNGRLEPGARDVARNRLLRPFASLDTVNIGRPQPGGNKRRETKVRILIGYRENPLAVRCVMYV